MTDFSLLSGLQSEGNTEIERGFKSLRNLCERISSVSALNHLREEILGDGFSIIDDAFSPDHAMALLRELKGLTQKSNVMLPNRTHFALPNDPTKHYLFEKPGIFEVDLHQADLRHELPLMNQLFELSKTHLIGALQSALPDYSLGNPTEDRDRWRTVKLQWNNGEGGCFPLHYDNPGSPNNRCLTCILYLNVDWNGDGDGGEITFYPFLGTPRKVEPLFNRLVIFSSNRLLHRTERSWKDRYCLTIWIDGMNTNRSEYSRLQLTSSAFDGDENIANTIAALAASPVQRLLSRAVYKEEYEESLIECMAGANEGRAEMLESHAAHLRICAQNKSLTQIVDLLRFFKTN